MPTATTAFFEGSKAGIEEALNLRDMAGQNGTDRPDFACVRCGEPVKPNAGEFFALLLNKLNKR